MNYTLAGLANLGASRLQAWLLFQRQREEICRVTCALAGLSPELAGAEKGRTTALPGGSGHDVHG